MVQNILKFLTISLLISPNMSNSQEIWRENFMVPEKGVWGSNDASSIKTDFKGVSTWTLDYTNIRLKDSNDYAKTVSTSGGRFECKDIDGEVVWSSEEIDISNFENVSIQLTAQEVGSGENKSTKYLKAYYKLNSTAEIPFEINGEKYGGWGTDTVFQSGLNGNKLQIVVHICNFYSADKVILDEVVVSAEEKEYPLAQPGDIVINEILFNPFPDGEDYVEIYNTSEKEFPTKDLFLASRDNDAQLTQIYSLSGEKYLLQAWSYLAATRDTNAVFPFYFIECPDCFQQVTKMPSFNNDDDVVVLLNKNMEIIDEFFYSEDLHIPWLANVDGVSLERISVSTETNQPGNWTSASTESGYGTPGYKNSQAGNPDISKPHVTFEPEAFSPNFDGFNDEYKIRYELDKPGYVGNVKIFDSKGHFVLQLLKNEILGTTGELTWNGKDETGQRQPLGVYITLVEIFDSNGQVFRFKDGVVLTDLLE
ncbi:lamin tail domain-containing protein [Maribellus maritimus]|uniref:lamin tail domain-containing protein n=1 Tax=Maribellus maritimus TaxID=2870838 RepID=UPI001EEB33CF|nr:gliding motility-associated C-terminal domain-containing protein [Maribellus maritimus]MCG6188652.1 gliding motility-associated C-terminal domain-containing protein [Maribellus maritimus]